MRYRPGTGPCYRRDSEVGTGEPETDPGVGCVGGQGDYVTLSPSNRFRQRCVKGGGTDGRPGPDPTSVG